MSPCQPTAVDDRARRQLLIKSWMTHDAMWLRHAAGRLGIDVANAINQAAVRGMAALEIRRWQSALRLWSIDSPEALRYLLDAVWEEVRGDFMHFEREWPAPALMRWRAPRCFAYEGVTALGIADRYWCGIFPRLDTWLDTLGVIYQASPVVDRCLMARGQPCVREYRILGFERNRRARIEAAQDQSVTPPKKAE
jgi:hypothetical protein